MMWCIQRTNIYLDERQCEMLDRLAADEGVSRAELIRRLLDRALAGANRDLAVDLEAIEASFGAAPDVEITARGASGREEHLERVRRGR